MTSNTANASMLHVQEETSPSEKTTSSVVFVDNSPSVVAPAPKSRSCLVCRSRKVRCDKQSPCSNCRRANIACVFPSAERPIRWARHHERRTKSDAEDSRSGAGNAMDRLRNLEKLVKELRSQLEQANAVAGSAGDESSAHDRRATTGHPKDASLPTSADGIQHQFGRLILQDSSYSHYVSSGFWSRIDDEVHRPFVKTPSC
jgi:hypothetical protein